MYYDTLTVEMEDVDYVCCEIRGDFKEYVSECGAIHLYDDWDDYDDVDELRQILAWKLTDKIGKAIPPSDIQIVLDLSLAEKIIDNEHLYTSFRCHHPTDGKMLKERLLDVGFEHSDAMVLIAGLVKSGFRVQM